MSWGFTPEWLAERERRKKLKALGSTGPVDAPTVIGNCELVKLEGRPTRKDGAAADPRNTRVPQASKAREDLRRAAPSEGDSSATSRAVPLYPLVDLCKWAQIAEPIPEYPFAKEIGRRWRFDYAWPLAMLAFEVNGGVWTRGRHTRGQGAINDMEKASEAAILGWRILYSTPEELENGIALDRVVRALCEQAAA